MRIRGVIAVLVLALPAYAEVPFLQTETDKLSIEAESVTYDQKTDSVSAVGGVVIRRGDSELRADRVDVRRSTGDAAASGNVVLTDPDGSLSASELQLNLDDETGEMLEGKVESKRFGYALEGRQITKGLGQRFLIKDGKFTTCICNEGVPSWSVAGKSVDVEANGVGHLEGGTFNVLDRPIFYLPRALFPVSRERQSGFLLPRYGYSNRRGFQVVVPFYLAINRSHDMTFATDFETGARYGLLGEYRYALSPGSGGQLSASYFNESIRPDDERTSPQQIADPHIPVDRWSVVGDHRQQLPYGVTGYADLFLISDDLLLREINTFALDYRRDVLNRTRRYTESDVGFVRTWDRAAAQLDGTFYQDLIQPDDLTLQRAPRLRVWGQESLLDHLVYGGLDAQATAFERRAGVDGLRLDLHPTLTMPIPTASLPLNAAVHVGVRETAYQLTERQTAPGTPDEANLPAEFPDHTSRETFDVGADVSTEIGRVYNIGGEYLQKLKHTIEPVLSYTYVPTVAQEDIPVFDEIDRMNRRNLITYGIVNRLFGRFREPDATEGKSAVTQPSLRELMMFSVLQSYDLQREIAPVGQPLGPGSDHFSDIDFLLRASPWTSTSVFMRSSYDTSNQDLSAAEVSIRLTDPRPGHTDRLNRLTTRSTGVVSYRFITQNELQQVDASMLLQVTDMFGFLFATRYDVNASEVLETHFGLRLVSSCDCWGLDFAVTDKSNPSEVEVRAQFTLVGLGSSHHQGGLGFP